MTTFEHMDVLSEKFGVSRIWIQRKMREWLSEEVYVARRRERTSNVFSGEGNPRYGAVISDEQKAKHSASLTGFRHTPETLEKMQQSKLGKPCPEHVKEFLRNRPGPRRGHKATEETLEKLRNRVITAESRERRSLAMIEKLAAGTFILPYSKTLNGTYETRLGVTERYDSSWELRRMTELDEAGLTWTKKHGVVIPYLDSKGHKRRYYPDFQVTDPATGQTWIEEVKGYETPLDLIKYSAARPFCQSKGWDFRVLNSSHFSQRLAG